MTTYIRNVGEYHNTWTGRYLPDGFVGRVTGGGPDNPSVGGTNYPGAVWEDATEVQYEDWRAANPPGTHPHFKPAAPLGPTLNKILDQATS